MKKFKFRLQTVLELKTRALDEKSLEIAQITSQMNKEIEEKQNIELTHRNIISDLESEYVSNKQMDINLIRIKNDYLETLQTKAKNQEAKIKIIEKHLAEKRKELEAILKEKKVLEKLKEKQEEAHYKEIEYQQQQEMEDISSGRYKVG